MISQKERWLRRLMHMPVGWLNGLAFVVNPMLGILFGAGFLIFELNQDKHKKDRAFYDIDGWLFGLGEFVLIFTPWLVVAGYIIGIWQGILWLL